MKWNIWHTFLTVALLAGCAPTSTNVHQCPPDHFADVGNKVPAARAVEARLFHVVRVIDGDTVVILYDEVLTSVRLPRIQAPCHGTCH